MTTLRTIGIDPGPQPGLCLLRFGISTPWWPAEIRAIQCDADSAPDLLAYLLNLEHKGTRTIVGCERFVRGNRSAKAAHPAAVSKTERMINEFHNTFMDWEDRPIHTPVESSRWVLNNASRVKKWAKYERLDAAGLLDATKGMTHCRDAAKHALFVACEYGMAPDPLSRSGRRS